MPSVLRQNQHVGTTFRCQRKMWATLTQTAPSLMLPRPCRNFHIYFQTLYICLPAVVKPAQSSKQRKQILPFLLCSLRMEEKKKRKRLPQDIQRVKSKVNMDVLTLYPWLLLNLTGCFLRGKSPTVLIRQVCKWLQQQVKSSTAESGVCMQNLEDSLKFLVVKFWYQRSLSHTLSISVR